MCSTAVDACHGFADALIRILLWKLLQRSDFPSPCCGPSLTVRLGGWEGGGWGPLQALERTVVRRPLPLLG